MIDELYAPNHRARRDQALLETGGCCSRCKRLFGPMKLSRSRNLCFEQPHLHHPDGDPENPQARVEVLCDSCHMRAHRQVEQRSGKAAPRKQGYEVMRIPVFLAQLRGAGLKTWVMETGQVGWQIGALSGQAETDVEAIVQSIHWMAGEIRDLEAKLQQREVAP